MQITISGKGMDVGEALRSYVEDRIEDTIGRYLDRVSDVKVIFTKEGHRIPSEIVFNTGTHSKVIIKGNSEAEDAHTSFDMSIHKIESQLKRYKSKLTDHHKREAEIKPAMKYVISPEKEEVKTGSNPLIIAEKATNIETLSVNAAVMKMDLADLPALLFRNSKSGNINVVYHRKDGNISWVDSE